jgi:Ni,Fe-hydrogenase III small subunit
MITLIKTLLRKGRLSKKIPLPETALSREIETMGAELRALIARKFGRSFHIREVDTGSCGACESEIIACTNPLYDIQRFGVDIVASPRHADALLVTGPVSKNMAIALTKTYNAMPRPNLVITCGDCSGDGGIFKNSYYTHGGVNAILPVACHIPGCPPKPIDIIRTLLTLLKHQ